MKIARPELQSSRRGRSHDDTAEFLGSGHLDRSSSRHLGSLQLLYRLWAFGLRFGLEAIPLVNPSERTLQAAANAAVGAR